MYRPRAFAVDDRAAIGEFIRTHPFATVAAAVDGAVMLAHAPVVLEGDTARFHLAAANPLARHGDGARLTLSFVGPHAYVSPDWYASTDKVPTWNYMAVEGAGVAHRLSGDALRQLLVDLSAAEEAHLLPKKPWTLDKVPADKQAMLMNAIVGFSLIFDTLEGKFKLSQNMNADDHAGAVAGLDARGDAQSAAVAKAMKEPA